MANVVVAFQFVLARGCNVTVGHVLTLKLFSILNKDYAFLDLGIG